MNNTIRHGNIKTEILEDKYKNYYFTFCQNDEKKNYFVKIKGSFDSVRQEMFKRYGNNWSFQYSEKQWNNCKHPITGEIGTQEKIYNLREVKMEKNNYHKKKSDYVKIINKELKICKITRTGGIYGLSLKSDRLKLYNSIKNMTNNKSYIDYINTILNKIYSDRNFLKRYELSDYLNKIENK